MNKATLNLFNAIQTDGKKKATDLMFEKTVGLGFVFAPDFKGEVDDALIQTVSDVIGISGIKANSTFHKSWKLIEETSQEELMVQQMVHYLTTYGFQAMGVYSDSAIYIPNEMLKLPEITDDIKLVVIKSVTSKEIEDKIIELASGVALKDETLKDIVEIIQDNGYGCSIINDIKNRELKSKLYDLYDIVPQEPVEYLRFIVSRITDESLLIKSPALIGKIKGCDSALHIKTLDKQLKKAPDNLAKIFLRYKPIFLALKSISTNKTFFNHLRKKADSMHQPLQEDFLNSVTGKIKAGDKIVLKTLKEELGKVNIFRKIRLAYALKFRTKENDSIVYKIRNGKGYVKGFEFNQQKEAERVLKTVLKSIEAEIDVKGKTIYIPDYINYALPATEKQFSGNFPSGTYVSVPEDMVAGIHWENTNKTVDLDLSAISATGKTGWDSYYKSEDNNVLFSGDITSAPKPNGATEAFYIKKGDKEANVMFVNYYNFNEGDEVVAKVFVAHEAPENFGKDYMVDVNNIVASTNVLINKKDNILGLIVKIEGENRFYFSGVSIGDSISSSHSEYSNMAREYLVNSLTETLDFKEILENAGAVIVGEKPKKKDYIDLSPEALDKTTIINLITNNA